MGDSRTNVLPIKSPDGAAVRGRVFVPRRDEPAYPVCLVLPAMGVRASYYEAFALSLGRAGIPAVTVDLAGQGESSERASSGAAFGYRDIVDGDVPAAVAAVEARFSGRAVVLVGHSLGRIVIFKRLRWRSRQFFAGG